MIETFTESENYTEFGLQIDREVANALIVIYEKYQNHVPLRTLAYIVSRASIDVELSLLLASKLNIDIPLKLC